MEPPQLPEQWVVLILRAPGVIKVWVIASEHIQVGVVCYTAVSAAGRGGTMSWRGEGMFNVNM